MNSRATVIVVVVHITVVNGGAVWRCADGEG